MGYQENNEITGERNLPDKITSLKNLAKSYDMRMRGFKWESSNDKWVIAGKALAGSNFITQSVGIITSFAEYANLMTTKTKEKFMMEFADAFYRVNTMILNDESIPQELYRAVIKMFKDTMSNIGDIIVGSKETMKKIFEKEEFISNNQEDYN
jgi:hypothetical protein